MASPDPKFRALTLGPRGPVEFKHRTHREVDLRMQSVAWNQHRPLAGTVKGGGQVVTSCRRMGAVSPAVVAGTRGTLGPGS